MKKQFLEAGKIVNTHGVRGEVRIQPWADSPEFLSGFKRLYIDGEARRLISCRVHKECVIAKFEGLNDINEAMRLKNKIVYINRDDAKRPEGHHFISDTYGISVYDESGALLGTVSDVMTLPANDVYVVKGEREILIPAVPEFVKELDLENERMTVKLIEGM